MKKWSLFIAALMASAPSFGHTGGELGAYHAHSFVAGWWHPITGLDHLLIMLGVGFLAQDAVVRHGINRWTLPAIFLSALMLGALLGWGGLSLPFLEPMIALSLVLMGLLMVTRWAAVGFGAKVVLAFFAVVHGWVHGVELPPSAFWGMAVSALMLQALGMAFCHLVRDAPPLIPKAVGALMVSVGLQAIY